MLVTGIQPPRVRAVNDSFLLASASLAPKDLGALDSCDKHRNEGEKGKRSRTHWQLSKAQADEPYPPVIGGKIPISRAPDIGSSCSTCSISSATRITSGY
ncbi:hypothetical protein CO648_28405 [Rhizobium phaseoli]|nr:hypothetical protein CO648_28405 [Rhizobium phaseoli]